MAGALIRLYTGFEPLFTICSLLSSVMMLQEHPKVKWGGEYWTASTTAKDSNDHSSAFIGGATALSMPCLQRLLQASGETIAAVHGAAIGQDSACIAVETFDR
jgi:hypothetical protein